ncbi:uncharacterized protein LOC110702335 [Chenopodium quinoa]|uniref:uncharacterized protein LOC110702335 n=1 Tax=Chenopodium quinoa TaxID=63459 RepID=UPI000B78ED9C|nr:uncharacterized protein LOC110702335 [Chenopodium quinoa]
MIAITDKARIWCDNLDKVADAFVDHYKSLLGTGDGDRINVQDEIVKHGDKDFIDLILRSLYTFVVASCLVANEGMSNIYCCNVEHDVKEDIIRSSGFKEGTLPFKYLGINVSAKKLAKDDFKMLIDKITGRIRSWGCKTLSYADGVAAIYRNFLWSGKEVYTKSPLIALDIVCRSKKQGG